MILGPCLPLRRVARARTTLLVLVISLVGGCGPPPPKPLIKRAAFGVLFGGQIQERRELPFELDGSKQTLGFRVEFSEPLRVDTGIEWRIDRPAGSARARAIPGGKTPRNDDLSPLVQREVARAGESRFDRVVAFEPGDPLGLWNVRVVVRGKVAIDRPFEVYDAADRRKNGPTDEGM